MMILQGVLEKFLGLVQETWEQSRVNNRFVFGWSVRKFALKPCLISIFEVKFKLISFIFRVKTLLKNIFHEVYDKSSICPDRDCLWLLMKKMIIFVLFRIYHWIIFEPIFWCVFRGIFIEYLVFCCLFISLLIPVCICSTQFSINMAHLLQQILQQWNSLGRLSSWFCALWNLISCWTMTHSACLYYDFIFCLSSIQRQLDSQLL
jgi:hypothetical protein